MVAREFRPEVIATVLWLLDRGLRLQCIKVTLHEHTKGQVFASFEQIIPVPEAENYLKKSPRKKVEATPQQNKSNVQSESESWLKFIAGRLLPPVKGSVHSMTIGEMLQRVMADDPDDADRGEYVTALSRIGFRLGKDKETGARCLIVANQTPLLLELHKGSNWAGAVGAVNAGWSQAALSVPGAKKLNAMCFAGGVKSRAVAMPLERVQRILWPQDDE